MEQAGIWYSGPWIVLAEAAGVRLLAWDQETEPGSVLSRDDNRAPAGRNGAPG